MRQLATAEEMQGLDRRTIEEVGVPGVVLMENAGQGTADFMERKLGSFRGKSVVVFAGPGNNGGDGLVIARHVHQRGGFPHIFFLVDPDRLKGDAAINCHIIRQLGLPYHVADSEESLAQAMERLPDIHLHHPVHSLVDALFGTGLGRPLEGRFLAATRTINSLKQQYAWPVVSVDIPSGLHADSGQVLGGAVEADLTVTYGLAKPGHFMHGGPFTGTLHVVDIGIPPQVIAEARLAGALLDQDTGNLLRARPRTAHKGTCGHLLILAGSEGKTGAAILCARGALHSGSGLVTLAVPHGLNPIFETSLPEAMTVPLPSAASMLSIRDLELVVALLKGKKGLVLGPGLGTDSATEELVVWLYREMELPMVVDADALNLLARHRDGITRVAGPRILTPHPGEMARLTGLTTAAIQADRLSAALWLKERGGDSKIITVLKGAGTVIGDTDGRWAVNSSGNPGMATGGMGDVLSGIIGGLLAQGYGPWHAACLGVYLHGAAADLLAGQAEQGYLASDIAAILPCTMTLLAGTANHGPDAGTTETDRTCGRRELPGRWEAAGGPGGQAANG